MSSTTNTTKPENNKPQSFDQTVYDFTLQAGQVSNATVSEQFFGGNLLFDRDRIGPDGTYDDKAEALAISFFRYPGGAISEAYFDLKSPDTNNLNPEVDLLSLSDFVAYVGNEQGTAALVLPSIRYMRALANGEMTEEDVRKEFSDFLTKLKSGEFGDASVFTHIEIGNEYYAHRSADWNAAAEYAEFAPIVAEEIRKVFDQSVKISVQAGINGRENKVILDAFLDKGGLVDAVSFHNYPWQLESIEERRVSKLESVDLWSSSGIAEEEYLSEWSISNQRISGTGDRIHSDTIDDGMARAVATIELAVGYIEAGVEAATVWPVQQNTRGDLAGNEGETFESHGNKLSENNLTLTGEAFRLMAEALPGKKLVDVGNTISVEGGHVFVHGFESEDELVLFVSAYDVSIAEGAFDLSIDLGRSLTAENRTELFTTSNPELPGGRPAIVNEDLNDEVSSVTVRIDNAFEINRFTFDLGEDRNVSGSLENDVLLGGDGSETFNAFSGDDTVRAGRGDDRVNGDAGADDLFGEDGNDRILGRNGEDRLSGGHGDDTLSGGAKQDFLSGQQGDDKIRGGGGDDMLLGQSGSDILTCGNGDDVAKSGSGADTILGGGGDDTLIGGGGNDQINGGRGDDVLVVSAGDAVTGGLGADTFIIKPSTGTLTITDFDNANDQIILRGVESASDLELLSYDNGVAVRHGDFEILFSEVSMSDVSVSDFIY